MTRPGEPVMTSALTTIGFLNVCSLRGKVREVADFLSSRGVDVFGLAETWLKPSISEGELEVSHYNLFRKDRLHRHGGGVCVYCHESLSVRRRTDLESDALEIMWLDIGNSRTCIRIGCGYRPPHMTQAYWDAFEANVEGACFGTHATTILVGDFNIDIRFPRATGANSLLNLMTRLCLNNYVTQPTRITAHSQSLIDLFLSTSPIQGSCETVWCDVSDHNAILARLSVATTRQRAAPPRVRRKLCGVNWEAFNEDLRMFFATPTTQDIESMASAFTGNIVAVLNKHAPLVARRKTRTRRPCPWLTNELVDRVRDRNRLHRCLMLDRTNNVLRQEHKDARARARRLDRQLRNAYFLSQCNTPDQRKLWRVMNTVSGRLSKAQEPKASMDDLSKQFGDVVTDVSRPATLPCPEGPAREYGLASFHLVTIDDVRKCLSSVDPHKAVGSDMVPGVVLKSCATVLAEPLTEIINASLSTGCVPLSFKSSHICPLFKSGDPCVAKNYRPVSLLPIVSRILEFFVKQQLTAYLSTQQLFPASQFAYRRQHSTEDAVVLAVNRWLMAKAERKYTGVVMVDMSKAFDRVQHARMVSILFSLGVSGIVLQWFRSYLSDRSQCIRIGNTLSTITVCSRGVPQGSVLGPLLFILYTSELSTVLPISVVHQEFADDIILDCSDYDATDVCNRLTVALTRLADWLDSIGLLLNAAKTQVMLLKPRGRDATPCIVSCRGTALEVTRTAKYLGVVIDDELTWQPHADHLSRKCGQATGQLWRSGRSFSLRARRTWYISMIQSRLLYASNAFSPSLSKGLICRIEKLSKAGVRAVFRVRPHTETSPLRCRLKGKANRPSIP